MEFVPEAFTDSLNLVGGVPVISIARGHVLAMGDAIKSGGESNPTLGTVYRCSVNEY